ncbi:hypothetical protein ACP4OV_006655 [Aristida adscensionis]
MASVHKKPRGRRHARLDPIFHRPPFLPPSFHRDGAPRRRRLRLVRTARRGRHGAPRRRRRQHRRVRGALPPRRGRLGAVVKARHRATGETVAIKRLVRGSGSSDSGGRAVEEQLLREARFHEACDGVPFVVGFRGLARDPATAGLCLVMECVGPSLADALRAHRHEHPDEPLPEARVRAAMYQLLTAAKGMHERRVVHRDIKPQNILVGDDHRVLKICDFGLAASTAEAPAPLEPAGTLYYEAPEVLLEMPEHDALVDVWSLGCVMLLAIFDTLGVPDEETWPGFSSTAFATETLPELEVERCSHLREMFPETKLSEQGFEVLNGLLTCNPGKRLTAAAALKLPWFAEVDALELPRKGEVASALRKRNRKKLLMVHQDSPKRRKLQCV